MNVRLLACSVLFALAACDDATGPAAPSQVAQVVIDTTRIPLVRTVTVTMQTAGPARVTWGAEGTPTLTLTADSASLTHRFLITRLRQGKAYTVEARGSATGAASTRVQFTTDSLPPILRAIQINQVGTASLPVAFIEVVGATQFGGLLIVEDGQIVGWLPLVGSLFGATQRDNGNVVMLDGALGLTEYTLGGTLVRRLPHPETGAPTPYGRIHHEVIASRNNTLYFIANDTKVVGTDTVVGEAIWEWNPEAGTTTQRFTVFDHLNWNTLRGARSTTGNWLHGNGLNIGPRGNLVMSLRNADQAISISPDFQRVEWTLGGSDGQLGIATADKFFGQHYVSEPTEGRLLVFDNGFERPGGSYSRAIEYQINVAGDTATKVWEYRNTPEIYASLVGSARRLPNGNTSIMFGMYPGQTGSTGPVTAVEVTPAGVPVWRLTFGPQLTRLYRITPKASLLGEAVGEFSPR